MATANTITDGAYRLNSILNPSTAQDDSGLEALNNMISSWSAEGLLVPYNTIESFTLAVGKSTYTIGSGGEFDTVRPLRIIDAFIRDSGSDDYPVDVSMTRVEYNAITQKDAEARPTRLYFDPQYPKGKIYFNYEPDTAETLYLTSEKTITEFAALSTTVDLPAFYKEALVYNLAIRLSQELDTQLAQETLGIAIFNKNTIENINARDKAFKQTRFDSALTNNLYRG